jgi:hypothetical protein
VHLTEAACLYEAPFSDYSTVAAKLQRFDQFGNIIISDLTRVP